MSQDSIDPSMRPLRVSQDAEMEDLGQSQRVDERCRARKRLVWDKLDHHDPVPGRLLSRSKLVAFTKHAGVVKGFQPLPQGKVRFTDVVILDLAIVDSRPCEPCLSWLVWLKQRGPDLHIPSLLGSPVMSDSVDQSSGSIHVSLLRFKQS
jgi:hypothetical protein